MPVSKQRKNHKQKSKNRTNKMLDDSKRISKKFLENYRKIMEARNESLQSKSED
jgi:hypothetical protein